MSKIYNFQFSMKKFNKKISFLLTFGILLSSLSPIFIKPVNAIPVEDFVTEINTAVISQTSGVTAGNTTLQSGKEFGFDTLAWLVVNLIIERMSASTVNWINTGFQGSPAYVTDPEAYFLDIGDKIAGQFILNDPDLNLLCGPIRAKIRLALSQNYMREPIYRCTLTDVVDNIDSFMNDFSQGGWDGFFELTQRTQNSPIGAYLQAENELDLQIATRQGTKRAELNWGQGFMSFNECEEYGPPVNAVVADSFDENGLPIDRVPANTKPVCLREKTNTPGSVISEQLNKQLGVGQDKLAAADEINEIVSALLNQLIGAVVGGIGKGLRGLSSGDASSGNQKFTGQLTNKPAEVVGYFCYDDPNDPNDDPNVWENPDTPSISVLNIPVPDLHEGINPICDPLNTYYDPSSPYCN